MPDPIARKRLKKKMLDRWENEGGKIAADPTGRDDTGSTSKPEGKSKKVLASHGNSTVGRPASPTKSSKPNRN